MDHQIKTVDQYNQALKPEVLGVLDEVRATIRDVLPDADEVISYQMPTFTLDGKYVVYVSGWARHISLYPMPTGDDRLVTELEPYRAGKGTLRFPLDKPIPHDLIRRAVQGLLDERRARA